MLKELASRLCSLFVPRKSVSGGGGSRLIYGSEADRLSLPNWSNPVIISLPDGDGNIQNYVAPHACFVVLVVDDSYPPGTTTSYSLIKIASVFVTLVRSYRYNNAVNCFLKKGDVVTFQWSGTGVRAIVYPLNLPN